MLLLCSSALECCPIQADEHYAALGYTLKRSTRLTVATAQLQSAQLQKIADTPATTAVTPVAASASQDQGSAQPALDTQFAPAAAVAPAMEAPAGHCALELHYFDNERITDDGACMGTVQANCEFHDLCEAAQLNGQSLTVSATGILKVKPAKIKVESGERYNSEQQYLAGNALVAYIPIRIAPASGAEQYQYNKPQRISLLKVKIGWYNKDYVYPDLGDNGEGVVPPTGFAYGYQKTVKLPEVEPGTFNLLLKRGDYIY